MAVAPVSVEVEHTEAASARLSGGQVAPRKFSWLLVDSPALVRLSRRGSVASVPEDTSHGLGSCRKFMLLVLLLPTIACLTLISAAGSHAALARWESRHRLAAAGFGERLRHLYRASDALSGLGNLLLLEQGSGPVEGDDRALVQIAAPRWDGSSSAVPAALLPEVALLRGNEQRVLILEAEMEWQRLHGFALQCADRGVCLLDAWAKLQAWKERKEVDRRLEQQEALVALGVPIGAGGLALAAGGLAEERRRLEIEEQQIVERRASAERSNEAIAVSVAGATRWQVALSQLGACMDESAGVVFRLGSSLCASCFGAGLERSTRAGSVDGKSWWFAAGLQLNKVLKLTAGVAVRTIVDALAGDLAEFLGLVELFIAVVVPEVLYSVVSVVGLAPLRAILGSPALLVPGHVAVLLCGSASLFFGFLLSRLVSQLYPGAEFGGSLIGGSQWRWATAVGLVLAAFTLVRGGVWYQSIVL